MQLPLRLHPDSLLGALSQEYDDSPIANAIWYNAGFVNDGLAYHFAPGTLAGAAYLTADMLLSGMDSGVFMLELQEGEDGRVCQFAFSLLPEVGARLCIPLEAVAQQHWLYDRQGAWVKPRVSGDRVDPALVDRMRLLVYRQADTYTRWAITPILVTAHKPLPLEFPALPQGEILDEFGQNALYDWAGKSKSPEEISQRLNMQLGQAPEHHWPEDYSRWGGWMDKRFEGTGYFRTQSDAGRWWLVDPEGYAFWSSGQDCVRANIQARVTHLGNALSWLPDEDDVVSHAMVRRDQGQVDVNYLQANLMRAFGPNAWHSNWAEITLAELRRAGFNTVGNWSEWEIAREAGFPYVRPLMPLAKPRTATIFRDLPDVFAPSFEEDAAEMAQQLTETRQDPAMIGYFLMNEPTWAFAAMTPALGMLYSDARSHSRDALVDFLRDRYSDAAQFAASWGAALSFENLAEGALTQPLSETAEVDLADFSAIMIDIFFTTLSTACRKVDPNHLNLGVRYYKVPPPWCLGTMHSFDVFSMNCYKAQVPGTDLQSIHDHLGKPTLIGEWHMGTLAAGLPAAGVGPRLRDQESRGQAYRVYLENAAALPWCIGVHHFTHYDQSALGRFDGEAYNIGLYDICNRPYEPVIQALRESHERLYAVAAGEEPPFKDAPEYLEPFFF